MKRSDTGRTSIVPRWSVIAALAAAGSTCLAAGSAEVGPAAASSARGPLTLMIQSPAGGVVRLTYVPDEGWKADPAVSVERAAASVPPSEANSALDEATHKPMTVFIDGPTGFTYFWSREHGWKFVGRLSDRLP
ncbi:hypothetical protein PPMP20_16440 [Paraburkholderia phymatum]|uniref:Uncharacterized protein n=1 Tax=Paraburkholderia phymatum (strain DSM 17167 / CIP 108236 / LMG 21445 / STM815) TaxID=391038 RepID=B2JSV9_PARP8|nr:hypothetical protein [Paraburkholderia phymatum]ACC75662.1 hypothetical protein Bphy_6634 [Paraburkholderia phymatum STM815]